MKTIRIDTEDDIVLARSNGREMARELGFGIANQTRLATAISELVRNVIKYAGSGQCCLFDESSGDTIRLRVEIEDNGPGIPDVELALKDGYSTGGSLGAGLPGTKRLVKEMNINTEPGHTIVTIVISQNMI